MKRLMMIGLVLLFTVSTVFAGGQQESGEKGDGPMKVALLLSGPANDQGWNAVALQGLQEAEEKFGIETTYTEQVSIADSEAAYTDYASRGYDLVIGHGYQFGEPAVKVGARFPDTNFMAIEANSKAENVASYVIACEEAGYLMGYLAASMSETGKLGIVGGIEQPSIVKILEAYKLGAEKYDPSIEVYDVYIGSFTDVALGKEAALSMADKGADVLSHAANQAGTGVIKAAQERGLLATGDSWDQSSIAPDTVICSTIYSVPQLVLNAVERVKNNNFEGGVFYQGMNEGVVDIAPYHGFEDKIDEEVKATISDLKIQINDGSFDVPIIEEPTS